MKARHLGIILLLFIAAPALQAADLYTLLPAASGGISLNLYDGEALVLAQLSGNNGGAALFKFAVGSSPEPLSSFEYGQRHATRISDPDSPVMIIRTADKGYALVVDLKEYNAPRGGIKRENCAWLIKLSADGKREWAEVLGETGLGYKPFGLVQTQDGGYLVTGSTTAGKVWKSLVIKTDARGALSWKKSVPSGSYASFDRAMQLANGGYLLYGYDNVQARVNYWLVRTGAQGEPLWQKTWPGLGDRMRTPLLPGTGGSFFGLVKSENAVPRLLAFNSAGALTLDNAIAGMKPSDMLNDTMTLPDGSIVYCGWTQNSTQDILLTKIGQGNRLLWRKAIHEQGDDLGLRVLKTIDPGYLLVTSTGYSYDYTTQRYSYKTTLIRTDESGNRMWSESYSIGIGDSIEDAVIVPDNRCVILMTTIRNAQQEALLLVTEPGGRIGTIRER